MVEPASQFRRVLLAEDNPLNQKIVSELLQIRGHSVKLAGNGMEVLNALDDGPFDVILMDVQMPEMDGYQTTAVIRSREKDKGGHVSIIAITGMSTNGDRERCLDAGMDGYLGKPIRASELYEAIEQGPAK